MLYSLRSYNRKEVSMTRLRKGYGIVGLMVLAMGWAVAGNAVAAESDPATAPVTAEILPVVLDTPESPKETVWVDDALPTGAQATGTWEWSTTQAHSGTQSHTEPAAAAGAAEHGFTVSPQPLPEGSVIVQYVYLDPQQPPRGLMLKLTLSDGSQTGVYWEGDEEVFQIGDEELSWYMDVLPEAGSWQRLEVWVDDFGLGGEQLTGLTYVAYGGKTYWDKTALEEHPELLIEPGDEVPIDEF
jgi:hypothetical protein